MTKRLVRVSVFLPESLYEELKRLKDEGKIRSMSEFIRNIVVYAMSYRGVEYRRKVVVEEEWKPIPRKEKKPEERGLIGYGSVHAELIAQLKRALAERRMKMQLQKTNT